ncbi:AAA family ATPase [Corynebacterium hindlerae]|uniref:AAA family ATPase n=1 Tax=Corynebacterium hindlerae TaxID=699041 RepID=UPI001AD7AC4F|nr:AAA family ATPase [Corynebacterium hindlerae]QTH59052.1 AAA family ATPase [Corynebacterium hindlerae]
MRIHDIELTNVRGLENFRLTDIPDHGVIVISGDNEAGKSTVIEAISTVQKYRHSSKNRNIKALQPSGKDVPITITLRATVGDTTFRIRKQYLRKASAELTLEAPRHEVFTGDAAEDKLANLLDEHVDTALAEALFVKQGDVDAAISAAGIPSLRAALERAEGSTDIIDDTDFMKAVETEYQRFYTAKGKESGELVAATKNLAVAEERYQEAHARSTELESNLSNFEKQKKLLEELRNKIPEAVKATERAKRELEAATQQQRDLDKALADLDHRNLIVKTAEQDVEQRAELAATAQSKNEQLSQLKKHHDELTEKSAAHSEKTQQAKENLAATKARLNDAREALSTMRSRHTSAVAAEKLDALTKLITDAEKRESAVSELQNKVPSTLLTKEQLQAVADATLAVTIAETKLHAESATLHLTGAPGSTVTVGEGEVALSEDPQEFHLTQRIDITIGDTVATFIPPSTGDGARAEVVAAKETLAALLAEAEVPDEETLRSAFDKQEETLRALQTARRELSAVLAGKDLAALRAEAEELKQTEPDAHPISVKEAATAINQLEAEFRDAESEYAAASAALREVESDTVQTDLKVSTARIDDAKVQLQRAQEQLTAARNATSDEELAKLATQAVAVRDQVKNDVDQLSDAMPDMELVTWNAQASEEKLAELRGMENDSAMKIQWHGGEVERAEGVAEQLIHATEAREAARYRYERVRGQADSINLLRSTLIKHRDAARERYAAPFAEKLSGLASTVFGVGVDFSLNDSLQIEQRVVDETVVPISDLSGGAQEQLGLLARFAIADLVADEAGVPIFVDDALGNTDTLRLELMNYVFSRMGNHHQVFVLTCMPSRYQKISGKTSFRMEDLKTGRP